MRDYLRGKKSSYEPKKSELEEYLGEALDETCLESEFDILSWWKLKVAKYPIMARLTRDVLVVPISTVASESTFSVSGRILSHVRSSLSDDSLEALICAQDWLKASVNGMFMLHFLHSASVNGLCALISSFFLVLCQKMVVTLVTASGPLMKLECWLE